MDLSRNGMQFGDPLAPISGDGILVSLDGSFCSSESCGTADSNLSFLNSGSVLSSLFTVESLTKGIFSLADVSIDGVLSITDLLSVFISWSVTFMLPS